MKQYLVWWLSGNDCTSVAKDVVARLPPDIKNEFNSRIGRPGRGRLWVPVAFGDVECVWSDDNPLCRLLASSGGIVFDAELVDKLPKNIGVVTDLNCAFVQ